MSGFFQMARGWMDGFPPSPFSDREAWIWLIEKAAWKDCARRSPKGERVEVLRGQFHTSLRTLGSAWGWGKNRVDRYLQDLVDREMIGTVAGQSGCLITICNYDKYQSPRDSLQPKTGTVAGQSRDIQEEGKEGKERKYGPRGARLPHDFSVPNEWLSWAIGERGWDIRGARDEASSFVDYWQAKSGRDAAKLDWEATWRNWVRRSHRQKKTLAI